MSVLDRRLHAHRGDLADIRLKGRVEAERFVAGEAARIVAPVADMRNAPSEGAGLDTQVLLGRGVTVFDRAGGWAWAQAADDGYVGYVREAEIGFPDAAPGHVVVAPRSFVYPGPDMKLPRRGCHSIGARLKIAGHVEQRGLRYAILENGEAMVASHLAPAGHKAPDYVAVAESLLNTPYLWGGASGFGIDCSGLVQLSMTMAGKAVPRDTDMQVAAIGEEIDAGPDLGGLRRGDLVFWKGHVGIMRDAATLLHASGHAMLVVEEPLRAAVDRIAALYGPPTRYRRP